MREVKLRAWDDVLGEMLYSDIQQYDDSLMFRFDKHFETDAPVYLRYTGLMDKNGKDVYEGDIINCTRGCPHLVEWVQEYGGTYFGGMPAFYLSGLKNGYAWTCEEEVIGNIYENPDLMRPQANDTTE